MTVNSQQAAVALMMRPSTHGIAEPVERIETHISLIFLAGNRAWKMKRAVKLPYVDFSTPDLRLAACAKELELNSKTAPGLYLRVLAITRTPDGDVALNGSGELVDAVVEMTRFDQSRLFNKMALAGKLTTGLMTDVAHMVAHFHRHAPLVHGGSGAARMARVLDVNEAGFLTSHVFDAGRVAALDTSFRLALARHAKLLNQREGLGHVRRCHGDLHLRNICLLDNAPALFDCIEFSEEIATVDVLYDLAFLLMDLWHCELPLLANVVANRYLDETNDETGLGILPFFMAVRAAVRAHVTATQVRGTKTDAAALIAEAKAYFALAERLLGETPPRLIAIGGLSGSGKSTIAEALAPHIGQPPGARSIESDRVRKSLCGVSAETRLPDAAYRPQISDQVYREMASRAGIVLAAGGSVVANAVFDRTPDQERIESIARDCHVPFHGFWLDTDADVLRRRVAGRVGGPSDATVDILARQLQAGIGPTRWHPIDASQTPDNVIAQVTDACG